MRLHLQEYRHVVLKPHDQVSCRARTEDLLRDRPILPAVWPQHLHRKQLAASTVRHSLDRDGFFGFRV